MPDTYLVMPWRVRMRQGLGKMAETIDEYPQRPPFYAYKLTRLMFKTALANDIGPEACHMIIQIAHTEDATRYCKAVKFYNEQLMPVCGFANVKALDRARAKAVAAGWLKYIPGGKGVAGKYWTLVPDRYANWEDSSIDESSVPEELEPLPPVSLPVAGNQTGEKRETNGIQTPDKRATIYPTPKPLGSMYTGESPDSEFVPVKAFTVQPAVTAIEVNGSLVEYHEHPLEWETEFIRLWNKLPGVHKRHGGLDSTLRSALQARLCEPHWYWKRAFALFPTTAGLSHTENLTWFFGPRTVSSLLDGTYHPTNKEKSKGKKHDRQGPDNSASTYNPNAPDDGWGSADRR